MDKLSQRMAALSPEKRKLLEASLKQKGIKTIETGFTAIQPVPESDHYPPGYYPTGCYPASSAQKRLFLLDQLAETGTSYNIPAAFMIEGNLDRNRVENVLNQLVRRHESFRTSLELIDGEPVQRIWPEIDFQMEYKDMDDGVRNGHARSVPIIRQFIRPFVLSKAPLLRVSLIKLSDHKHLLLFDMHHLISDGASMNILIRDFVSCYKGETLLPLRIQYKDYAAWQSQAGAWQNHADAWQNHIETKQNVQSTNASLKRQEQFWLQQLSGEIPVLNLPLDYPRPALQSFEGDRLEFEIGPELTRALKQMTLATGTTLYMTLLAAFNILLFRYTGQEDIMVGTPVAGRSHADLESIIGFFINTLVMRNYPESPKSFREFLAAVRGNSLQAYENQDYQFEELIEKLNIQRDLSRNPLFDVMFVLQNVNPGGEIPELRFTPYDIPNPTTKFDLTLQAVESGLSLTFTLEYCTRLFKKETIARMSRHFTNILAAITTNPNQKLSEIELLSPEERRRILTGFNTTQTEYPREKTIPELFEEQVERTPENIAVVFETEMLTYKELNQKANQLAHCLRNKGVGPDTIVAIMTERSMEMIIGILGILKAGSAYLPIDPEYPEERIKFILTDSQTGILLTQGVSTVKSHLCQEVIDLDKDTGYDHNISNPEPINQSHDLAYIIYTSGSTGKPKGVMIEHFSLVNILLDLQQSYPAHEKDAYLLKTSYTFDVSVVELFGWFLGNGRLVILPPGAEKSPQAILAAIAANHITHLNFVPSMLHIFLGFLRDDHLEIFNQLKYVFVAGEAISKDLVHQFYRLTSNIIFENLYGPTESTIYATKYSLSDLGNEVNVPIGKPLANIKAYVLDQHHHLLPIGIPGELCLSGSGLARGYLNKVELTAEKFIEPLQVTSCKLQVENQHQNQDGELQHVFGKAYFEQLSTRFYQTGDLVRWRPDGNIEFLGRIDHQVKIRGFRIELGEIENRLLTHPKIKEVVIVAKESVSNPRKNADGASATTAYGSGAIVGADKYLCAYFVADQELTVSELRQFLGINLPEYMIPSYFVQLENLPINRNGKIDRNALPKPEGAARTETEYEAPADEIEAKLAEAWREVLGVERVGVNDNFFELGGHSLKAAILASKIHQVFNVEVPLREIFQKQTVRQLGKYIAQAGENIYAAIEPAPPQDDYPSGCYPVSSAQKRLLLLHQIDSDSTAYNISTLLLVEGQLERIALERAFQELILRHESLRTSFEFVNDEPVQRIAPTVEFRIEYDEGEPTEIQETMAEFIKPFDLRQVPLLRVKLVKTGMNRHLLMFDMSHIISDGTSMGILVRELAEIYQGKELLPLRIQYKDYSAWQRQADVWQTNQTERQRSLEGYWLERFQGELPVLNLPLDHPRPASQSFEGSNFDFQMEPELTGKLNELAIQTQTTLYMVLLAGFNLLLSRYSGQEDIIIGSPIAGRTHADLQNIIGMFVNTLAMRNYPVGSKRFLEFLAEVRQDALSAYAHQDYPFEELVEKTQVSRDLSRNPLFDVMFVLQNMELKAFTIPGLTFTPYPYESRSAQFDLTLSGWELPSGEISFNLEYCTKLFTEATIHRLANSYQKILRGIAESPDQRLADIEILPEQEKLQLVFEFNDTAAGYPKEKTIVELFEEQAQRTPDNIAVTFGAEKFTYTRLNQKANQLAHNLRNKGVGAEIIVGIMVERSMEMIIGILSILKAGGAYLPIDPQCPADRIQYMLQDCGAQLLLTQTGSAEKLDFNGEILYLDHETTYLEIPAIPTPAAKPENLAYIIYTSGSTGQPKGVMVEHRNVTHITSWFNYRYNLAANPNLLQMSNYIFDASIEQIFSALLHGATLHCIPQDLLLNKRRFLNYIENNGINIIDFTPATLKELLLDEPKIESLKAVICGGEALNNQLKNEILAIGYNLNNHYGPTEITVDAVVSRCEPEKEVVLGKPIHNTRIYILNQSGQLQPVGVAGELSVAGAGITRGYLNNARLTEEKFGNDPFFPGEKIYRTGDLARWLPDGNIEFLGRIDHQVKIRGFRIEPGEIERRLLSHEMIREAVVVARESETGVAEASGIADEKYLCAYFTADKELSVRELRNFLAHTLPEYMIPAYFVQMSKLPLNRNGKIDRKALGAGVDPEPAGLIRTQIEYEAPGDEIEANLVEVWREVLGLERIGVNDNFFELGGHSLKAAILAPKIHQIFNVEVPLQEIFQKQTVRQLAKTDFSGFQLLP